MKQTLKLLGVNARGILGINKTLHGGAGEKRSASRKLIGFLAVIILVAASLYGMYYGIGSALNAVGQAPSLLSIAVVGASLITLLDVFFRTTNVLFSFSDYDIVMALPVKTSSVVCSRVISMYIFELIFSCMVMIPAFAAYCTICGFSVLQCLSFILMLITVPLIPITVGIIPGIFIGMAVSKMKHKNIMNILLSLVFVAGYMYLYTGIMQSGIFDNISSEAAMSISANIKAIYPPSAWFSGALFGNAFLALLFIGVSVFAISLMTVLLTLSFRKLHDLITAQKTAKNYKLTAVRMSSPYKALYKREWKRYLSSASYVLNTLFGDIMVLAAGVLAIVFRSDIQEVIAIIPLEFLDKIFIAAAFLVASLVTASTLSSVTISIEGKFIWTLLSLPVSAWSILLTKIYFSAHIGLIVSVISSALLAVSFDANLLTGFFMLLIPVLFTLASSTFGLFINVHFPKFDWKNEMQVVKQSSSVLVVNVVGMMLGIGLTIILLMTDIDAVLFSGICSVVLIACTVFMLTKLKSKSEKLMLKLAEK